MYKMIHIRIPAGLNLRCNTSHLVFSNRRRPILRLVELVLFVKVSSAGRFVKLLSRQDVLFLVNVAEREILHNIFACQ
jgi:hypothetical protein